MPSVLRDRGILSIHIDIKVNDVTKTPLSCLKVQRREKMDFDEIFGDYARLLYKYVLKLSHNEDVAEDREAATAVKSALKELPKMCGSCLN